MAIKAFENMIAWQKAKELTLEIYVVFGDIRDFGFRDQIQRASVSIMNNIAEGFERQSDRDFRRFLFIAKGSAGEVRSMLAIATELKYIDQAHQKTLTSLCSEIARILSGLIKTLS